MRRGLAMANEIDPEKLKRWTAIVALEFYIQELNDPKLNQLLEDAGLPRTKQTKWTADTTNVIAGPYAVIELTKEAEQLSEDK